MADQVLQSSNSNDQKQITYNDIASKLIQDKLLLTALEFHAELIESGRELKQLRDFFSNPGNFEQPSNCSQIARSGSQITLDSLDLTRFSEDGERSVDERVAVLEFELRKAKETITALRNNLTVAIDRFVESESNTPVSGSSKSFNSDTIKPHEQRALNFLVNEYLLSYGYKLTSITFSDENENQDFEYWDDVGLNSPRPAELVQIYREGLRQTGHEFLSIASQADFPVIDEEKEQLIINLKNEIDNLKSELEKSEFIRTELQNKYDSLLSHQSNENLSSPFDNEISSTKSISPETFEVIDKPDKSEFPKYKNRGSIVTIEDDESTNSLNENDTEWTRVALSSDIEKEKEHKSHKQVKHDIILPKSLSFRKLSNSFHDELLSLCFINVLKKHDNEMSSYFKDGITKENFIHIVSKSMSKIIPNIILNKREEVIPILISAVNLNPISSERDSMLQLLFNLKKKPSEDERKMILSGIVGIAKLSNESLVENEVLPQCWEQLTHKHVERRLLVAESCSALTPYVSSMIRNSLMLSMLQQLLEDRDASVREMAIKALALLIAYCDDVNKYPQCEELALTIIGNYHDNVVNVTGYILLPVLAEWALSIGKLHNTLLKKLLQKLNELVKCSQSDFANRRRISYDKSIIEVINILDILLPFILVHIAAVEPVTKRVTENLVVEIRPEFLKICIPLTNPSVFYSGTKNIGLILYEFDKFIAEENILWPEIEWFLDIVIPDLVNTLNHIAITEHEILNSFINLFSHICISFGKSFTSKKLKPIFQNQIQNLEQMLLNFNQYTPNFLIIPVYLISVLSYCGNNEELSSMLKRFICALPLCGTPLDCLEITVTGLCDINLEEIVINALWDGVVHQKPLVRSAAASLFSTIIAKSSKNLLNQRIAPAIITLASDTDILVRTATLPALGSLITDCQVKEIHDKAYMQLQSFLSDLTTKDNHAMLRQLVVTLGQIVNSCDTWFREEVILPQLTAMSAFTSQMSNQTRKVDMASALIESYSSVIYTPLNRNTINSVLMPGLKYLEAMDNKFLVNHRDTITAMIRETESRLDQSPTNQLDRSLSVGHINQGVEDVRTRMSKIFSSKSNLPKSNNLGNLQGIFRKK